MAGADRLREVFTRYGVLASVCMLTAVVVLVFVRTPAPAPDARSARPSKESVDGEGIEKTGRTPGRANVDHSLLIQEQQLREDLAASPADTSARMQLARFLHDTHRPGEAAGEYVRYLAVRPANRQAWLDLADCYAAAEEWKEAESVTTSLLERWPEDPAGMYNMGAILANTGRSAEAVEWWTRVRDANRDPVLSERASESIAKVAAP